MRVLTRAVPLFVTTAATAALGLHGADTLTLTTTQRAVAVSALALVALVEGLRSAVGGHLREQELQHERWVAETLRGLLVQIVQASECDWTELGVNAFLVRREFGFVGKRVLKRVGRERIRSYPPPSDVTWVKGKGVIGRCWETGNDVGVDLRDHFREYGELREEEWEVLPHELRLGLSYEDLKRTQQHGVVVASPIVDRRGSVIGVVSADLPEGPRDKMWNDPVRELLAASATTIRNLLE